MTSIHNPSTILSPSDTHTIVSIPLANSTLIIRRYLPSDAPALSHHANNPRIAVNMRNTFPVPYTVASATGWIDFCRNSDDTRAPYPIEVTSPQERWPVNWAIAWTGRGEPGVGEVVGGIGLKFNGQTEVVAQSAELGYWLSEEFWGKGWMTLIVKAFVEWTWQTFPVKDFASAVSSGGKEAWQATGLDRLEAEVFSWNKCGSEKVLEKCGFRRVGIGKGKIHKVIDGVPTRGDAVMFELLRQ